jgi:hypothetical protein
VAKVIVFTRAMIPFALENSDAVFISGARSPRCVARTSVYICMSGNVFSIRPSAQEHLARMFEGDSIQARLPKHRLGDHTKKSLHLLASSWPFG